MHDLWKITGNIWFIILHECKCCAGKSLPELFYLVTVNNWAYWCHVTMALWLDQPVQPADENWRSNSDSHVSSFSEVIVLSIFAMVIPLWIYNTEYVIPPVRCEAKQGGRLVYWKHISVLLLSLFFFFCFVTDNTACHGTGWSRK